jgi:hypothetical protein
VTVSDGQISGTLDVTVVASALSQLAVSADAPVDKPAP